MCLDRLATVVSDSGEREAACEHWREALEALSDLEGPKAERLREKITLALEEGTGP